MNKYALLPVLLLTFIATFFAQQAPTPSIKVDVDLVLVNVTVMDPEDRYVVGLEKKNFQVWEDKIEQQVEYFSTEDVPLSVGLIFDASGSMQPMLGYARQAALSFLETADASDEYFLVEFNDRPHVTVDLTKDIAKLQQHIIFIPARDPQRSMTPSMWVWKGSGKRTIPKEPSWSSPTARKTTAAILFPIFANL